MYDIDHAVKSLILRHRLQIREYKKEMGTIKIKVKADKQEESIFLSQKKLKSFFQALELISSFDEQRKQLMLIKIMQYVDSHIDPEIVYDTLLVDIYGKDFEKTLKERNKEKQPREDVSLEEFYDILMESVGGYGTIHATMPGIGSQFNRSVSFVGKRIYLDSLSFDPSENILTKMVSIHRKAQSYNISGPQQTTSLTLGLPEVTSYVILRASSKSEIDNLEVKEVQKRSKHLFCSECEILLKETKEKLSSQTILPIPKNMYTRGELIYYWMCKSCFSLLEPHKDLIEQTDELFKNYKVKLPPRFFGIMID